MRNSCPDVCHFRSLDEPAPLSAEELASVVVDDLRLPWTTPRQSFQRLLDSESHCVGEHRQVQTPVHQEAAIPIQDVHQVVPARRDVQIHQIHVPYLIRMVGLRRSLQGLGGRLSTPAEQIALPQDVVDLPRPQIGLVLVHHQPREPFVAHPRVGQGAVTYSLHFFWCR
jgi:hypothetical protein